MLILPTTLLCSSYESRFSVCVNPASFPEQNQKLFCTVLRTYSTFLVSFTAFINIFLSSGQMFAAKTQAFPQLFSFIPTDSQSSKNKHLLTPGNNKSTPFLLACSQVDLLFPNPLRTERFVKVSGGFHNSLLQHQTVLLSRAGEGAMLSMDIISTKLP